MKIDFNVKLLDLRDEPLEIRDKKAELVPATLGDVCSEAMLATLETDRNESGPAKYERWELAGKIIKADIAVELKSEEITAIKGRVGKAYGPTIVGPVYDLLEKKENADVEIQSDGESPPQES